MMSRLVKLTDVTDTMSPPASWPRLSIVIPACNEAPYIESALKSLLAQDYPKIEIIVVNDRSTDDTGRIIERLASEDSRITPIHIESLPAGWLGKVHALHRGVQHARGEWLLFTDADVHFAPGCLRRAINYAVHTRADHLALLPRLVTKNFWLAVAVRSFGLLFLYKSHAASIERADNQHYIGIGAFNLVRRQVFEQTPGFEWLRLEPGDDAALGMMMKQAGGKIRFALADDLLSLGWYPNVRAMFRGMEKNLFGVGAHYQWWRVLSQTIQICLLVVAPLLGLFIGFGLLHPLLCLPALLVVLLQIVFALVIADKNIRDIVSLLLFPAGLLLVNAMLIYAAYRCLRQQGIQWRGTHYPLAELKAGQRIRF
ncbi:MAG: glycosyltransferase family 2 protein [Gammaproteobacteria bacterium]